MGHTELLRGLVVVHGPKSGQMNRNLRQKDPPMLTDCIFFFHAVCPAPAM